MTFDLAVFTWVLTLTPLLLSTGISGLLSRASLLPSKLVPPAMALSLLLTLTLWGIGLPVASGLLILSPISWAMSTLTLFVSTIIAHFSKRYLDGDRRSGSFFSLLGMLCLSLCLLSAANHIGVLLTAWPLTALILSGLIAHRHNFKAARASARSALVHLLAGTAFVGAGLILMANSSSSSLISQITQHATGSWAPLLLIAIGVSIQSGLYPFEKWLIGSVNAPTPISALMHAGLINGGGVLIVKTAPLWIASKVGLSMLLGLGLLSAVICSLRKLLQPSIKTMLAYSTSAQMGFMLIQCSLGLFPAAITHLIWHGLFKANLFLNSGSAISTPEKNSGASFSAQRAVIALASGGFGAAAFYVTAQHPSLFCTAIIFLSASQVGMEMRTLSGLRSKWAVLTAAAFFGLLYGGAVKGLESALGIEPVIFEKVQVFSGIALVPLCLAWLFFNTPLFDRFKRGKSFKKFYVRNYLSSLSTYCTWTLAREDHDR